MLQTLNLAFLQLIQPHAHCFFHHHRDIKSRLAGYWPNQNRARRQMLFVISILDKVFEAQFRNLEVRLCRVVVTLSSHKVKILYGIPRIVDGQKTLTYLVNMERREKNTLAD